MLLQRWEVVQRELDDNLPPHWEMDTEQLAHDIVAALDDEEQ